MKDSKLTPKQEAFCIAFLKAENASDAYRAAGYSITNAKTVNEAASRLLKNSKVSARIAELRLPAAEEAQITLATHLGDLKRLRDMAESSEKYGPAVAAEIARGKASGLYIEKTELSGSVGVTVEIVRFGSNPVT